MNFDFASNDVLLGIDDVCKKLGISRSTLERLRKPKARLVMSMHDNDFAGLSPFPEPTVILGRSPRWSAEMLNRWLMDNNNPPISRNRMEFL